MSTAKFNTLSNLAGSLTVPVATVVQGSAKAWVNFNGTGTVAIRASFNVSSITDNGTGDFTVNMTTALADTNYSVNANGGVPGTWLSGFALFAAGGGLTDTPPTTTAFRFVIANSAPSALQDPKYVCVSVFR